MSERHAVHARHLHVKEHKIGRQLGACGEGLLTVAGLAHDDDGGILLQQADQSTAGRRLIVDDEASQGRADHVDCSADASGAESTGSGRILALNLHAWVIGQPHRMGGLESALETIVGEGGLWSASGAQIADAWKAQAGAVSDPGRSSPG